MSAESNICNLLAGDEFKEKIWGSYLEGHLLDCLEPIISSIKLNDKDWDENFVMENFMVVIRALLKQVEGDIKKLCNFFSEQLGEIKILGCRDDESFEINGKHFHAGDLVGACIEPKEQWIAALRERGASPTPTP
jgi:hypothetical protein